MLSDKTYDLKRALLEPARPATGRVIDLIAPGAGLARVWYELTEPQGQGLAADMPYMIQAFAAPGVAALGSNLLICYTADWEVVPAPPFFPGVVYWRQPTIAEENGSWVLPIDGTVYQRTWPEDKGFRVFAAADDVAAAGTARVRLHGMAPGSVI